MKSRTSLAVALSMMISGTAALGQEHASFRPVPFTAVQIDDAFWAPRLRVAREAAVPHNFTMCEETGRLSNFDKAAGRAEGTHEGYFFNDSDVYKVVEAAAYALAMRKDPKLEKYVDDLIERFARAQQEDGYLNTYYTLKEQDQRWSNLPKMHELYCAGHLIEAGVAHYRATGKRTLLDVSIKFADLIDSLFGPDRRRDVPGHPELELALVRLYDATGERRYLDLAKFFIDQRGHTEGRRSAGEYAQDHLPVREQMEVAGHAVRAMYLYCGMADLAMHNGDAGYLRAMDSLWRDVVGRRMYLTGGIGPSAHNEGFTVPYDLPNDTAYAETCASIGLAMWNHRLNLLHGEARYIDVLERGLYNGILSGISLDGTKYFYENPLASWGRHHRQEWYTCACCPPNLARFFLSLGGYAYAQSDDAIVVNLYIAGRAKIPLKAGPVGLAVDTRYPWDGRVKLTIKPEKDASFAVLLRVPDWCEGATVSVGGKIVEKPEMVKGYLRLSRPWKAGDTIELNLPMPPRQVEAHPRVRSNTGRTAIMRGPLVYCLEAADNKGRVRHLALPRPAKLTVQERSDLLGGVTVVRGTALGAVEDDWGRQLYRPDLARPIEFTAVPYYAWDNREPGEMLVWLPESPGMTDPTPMPGVTARASFCHQGDSPAALFDRLEPAHSRDRDIPRFTWWNHRGTEEWVQYDFATPRRVSCVSVYWYNDSDTRGGIREPASWKVQYRVEEEWRDAQTTDAFGVKLDQYNGVSFEAVETKALRLVVKLQEGFSAGILEWKVGEP